MYVCKFVSRSGSSSTRVIVIFVCLTDYSLQMVVIRLCRNVRDCFGGLFFMFILTWITEKELERMIENKRDEFCMKKNMKNQSGCETMRNASGQQGENERQ